MINALSLDPLGSHDYIFSHAYCLYLLAERAIYLEKKEKYV